ncbi:MAG: amidohydrolase family protein, partial [bacterium]
MELLITDTVVVTQDDERSLLDRAAIAIRGNCIAAVGESTTLERDFPDLPRFSGRGLAVFPGFINAHTHTALTVLRGTVEDWAGNAVYGYMSPVSYEMTPDERAVMVSMGCLEAIRSGCTTLVDPFRHVPNYIDAMAATGLRLWLSENCADINTLRIRMGDYSEDKEFGRV